MNGNRHMSLTMILAHALCYVSVLWGNAPERYSVRELRDPDLFAFLSSSWAGAELDEDRLNRLIPSILPSEEGWATEQLQLDEAMWIDLNNDRTKELAVTVSAAGPSGNVFIVIFFKSEPHILVQMLPTYSGSMKHFQDMDHDGCIEIIVREIVAWSTSRAEATLFPSIYRWNGRGYTESSARYPAYYNGLRDRLARQISDISALNLAEMAKSDERNAEELARWKELRIADMKVALYRIEQILGDKRSGFEQAVQWSASGDDNLKRNAIAVFEDIGDRESINYLKQAAQGEDEIVSRRAKQALRRLQNSEE